VTEHKHRNRLELAALIAGAFTVRALRSFVETVTPAVMRYRRASDRLVAAIEGKGKHAERSAHKRDG